MASIVLVEFSFSFHTFIHCLVLLLLNFHFRFHTHARMHARARACAHTHIHTHTHMWWISKMLQSTQITLNCIKIWNRMTASVLKQDPTQKGSNECLFNTDAVCKFSGISPLSSHKMTLCVWVKINKRSFEPFCVWILNCIKRSKNNTSTVVTAWQRSECEHLLLLQTLLVVSVLQTCKRLKRTLFIRTKTQSANFGGIPFFKLQNDTKQQLNGEKLWNHVQFLA